MKVAIIGASGNIGSHIRDEALRRGHQVTAIARRPEKTAVQHPRLTVVKGDVLEGKVDEMVRGHDVVISAYNGGWGNPYIYDDQVKGARAIIEGVKKARIERLLVVGGAGTLEVSPGVQLMDTVNFPPEVKGGVLATRETLYMLRKERRLDWVFLSPPASIAPGERTGRYRQGEDRLLKDGKGESRISTQDYAVAMLDEMESPRHHRERFTVAY